MKVNAFFVDKSAIGCPKSWGQGCPKNREFLNGVKNYCIEVKRDV